MTPVEFAAKVDALWLQVKPLYANLHCYVRAKLSAKYGAAVQPRTGPIRADLLGNMWAQEWGNIYDVVAPTGGPGLGYDLDARLKAQNYDAKKLTQTGEGFYTSIGLQALPTTFWERSQLERPRDREVVCHASGLDGAEPPRRADQGLPAHQRRRLLHRPPRTGSSLLRPRLRPIRVPCSAAGPTTVSTRPSATSPG